MGKTNNGNQIGAGAVTKNFFWRLLERTGAQGVTLVVSIVIARILAPEVYGTIALVTVFITIMQVFVDSGFGTALIQKKDADDLDFCTVFYYNLFVCILLYTIMFFAAPLIANLYKNQSLIPIIRVLSITLVINGVNAVQQAYVARNMQFKKLFFSTLSGTIVSAIVSIGMVYANFGVWALVGQYISNSAINTLVIWLTVKWRPKLMFSFKRMKGLFSFGWKILAVALIDTIYRDIRQLIIGKLYSSSDLAYYNKGNSFPFTIISNINSSLDSVLLPTMSNQQNDKAMLKAITRRAMKTGVYIISPLLLGLAFTSDSVITLLLTEKWLPCVPYMCIFCITYLFYPLHTANLNAIKALGRSDTLLKLEIIRKIVGLAILLSTMWFGPMTMAYSLLLSSVISQLINSWPNKKLLGYSYLEQIKDILPPILLAAFMGICVFVIGYFMTLPRIIELMIQVIIGGVIYILGSYLFKLESFFYCLKPIKAFIKKKKEKSNV